MAIASRRLPDPGTVTVSTSNTITGGEHTHGVTSSNNPGAAASLLASDASGGLQLVQLGISVAPVAQQATIVDADGTLADVTAKFNTLLAALEAFGLLAT